METATALESVTLKLSKEQRKVYIAAPYSKGDQVENIREVLKVADILWGKGFIPYVPHLSHLWHLISPKPYYEWLKMGEAWLRSCDCLLRLPGESLGADREVRL